METTTKNDNGSPDPTVQGKDGETANYSVSQNVKKVAPVIDADEANRALQLVAELKRAATHAAITRIQREHGLVGRSS